MRPCVTVLVCALTGVASLLAEPTNEIWQHNAQLVENTNYEFYGENKIRILQGASGQTFEFEAVLVENNQVVGAGTIGGIVVDSNNTGPVTISIVGHDGRDYGADDVDAVDLTTTGFPAPTSTIAGIVLSGDLGGQGPTIAQVLSGDIEVDKIVDDINVNSIQADITCTRLEADISCFEMRNLYVTGSPSVQPPDANITVASGYGVAYEMIIHQGLNTMTFGNAASHYLAGDVYVEDGMNGFYTTSTTTITGDVELGAVGTIATGPINGDVTIDALSNGTVSGDIVGLLYIENIANDLTVNGTVPRYATLLFERLGGTLTVTTPSDPVGGHIWGGDYYIGTQGDIVIGNVDLTGSISLTGDLYGTVQIDGDFIGTMFVGGDLIDTAGDTSGGHIIVNGTFSDTNGYAGEINIGGELTGTTTFVCIDYDGWDEDDSWVSGATVTVDGTPYNGNTPDARVWEVQPCRGDMDNNGVVNLFDADPFSLALSYPGTYAINFAGLAGSRVYHGDMNCSEAFNLFDIDPFTLRLSNPTEYWYDYDGCDPCQPPSESPLGGGEDDPYEFAASLAEVLSPAGMSFFADAAKELAESLEDEARAAYWAAVAEVLQ